VQLALLSILRIMVQPVQPTRSARRPGFGVRLGPRSALSYGIWHSARQRNRQNAPSAYNKEHGRRWVVRVARHVSVPLHPHSRGDSLRWLRACSVGEGHCWDLLRDAQWRDRKVGVTPGRHLLTRPHLAVGGEETSFLTAKTSGLWKNKRRRC